MKKIRKKEVFLTFEGKQTLNDILKKHERNYSEILMKMIQNLMSLLDKLLLDWKRYKKNN